MVLTHRDLLILLDEARKELLSIPGGALVEGKVSPLDDKEKLAWAWFQASFKIMVGKGLIQNIDLNDLFLADSDPETEYQDWTAEPEDD